MNTRERDVSIQPFQRNENLKFHRASRANSTPLPSVTRCHAGQADTLHLMRREARRLILLSAEGSGA